MTLFKNLSWESYIIRICCKCLIKIQKSLIEIFLRRERKLTPPKNTLYLNLPYGNTCGNAHFSRWSSDKLDKGILFCFGTNIKLFSLSKWETSDISEVSLEAVRYELPGSSAFSKFSSSKLPLILCVAEGFEKYKTL